VPDRTRRLTGVTVTGAALAVLFSLPGAPSDPASPPHDFGSAAAGHDASTTRLPTRARPAADVPPQEPRPERVLIREVGLDARIQPVGVNGQGATSVPTDPSTVGWYRFGPAPGSASGSVVLVGHVDGNTGALGEFSALHDVKRGDLVEVRRERAKPAVYRVVSRSTVPKDELPPAVFRRTGAPVLTLITCAPPFVPDRGGYLSNLVVTAEPVG
jgi:hypothetical protein